MFDLLRKSLSVGVVTSRYPDAPLQISPRARGKPVIDWANWRDARPACAVCPTGAIVAADDPEQPTAAPSGTRTVVFDLGLCVFCGLCADVDPAIRMTNQCELAAPRREDLTARATYTLKADGTHAGLISQPAQTVAPRQSQQQSLDALGQRISERASKVLGRSLHIREVDAGSCNGCEIEIVGLTSPIYDLERFGIHFVASPRHADMLLVTGPVTRNMELALKKTYDATPDPRLVVAVGACGCSGGIFGRNYATVGSVDQVIPVDVYVPGCPPNPHALLHGILTAVGRLPRRS